MKLNKYEKYLPPGYDPLPELSMLMWTSFGALCFSFGFFFRLFGAIRDLYDYDTRYGRKLIPGAEMPPYGHIFGNAWLGFTAVIVLAAVMAVMHYSSHRQGSKSVYLMKRLPNRWVYHVRCLALPAAVVFAAAVALAVIYGVYYGMYLLSVPEGCLPGEGITVVRQLGG